LEINEETIVRVDEHEEVYIEEKVTKPRTTFSSQSNLPPSEFAVSVILSVFQNHPISQFSSNNEQEMNFPYCMDAK
jgi:hypothetical protein